ncbi:DNA-binding transcriptional LysR family regulator [Streptacidiphilus sp. MAP12-20]|uniref:LysR family transcriptional regulator n=1 Tax=Streptacidiphilus sp. MAP12-20 TaxID=3156299 RepID=UPI003515FCF9
MTYDRSSEPLSLPAEQAELSPTSPAALLSPLLAQFAAVARREHVTRAAVELGMPQPTLSRAVARLEAELGVALLSREGRAVRLTRAGRIFLASAERALAELERGADAARAEADPTGGRVTFGFLHTMGSEAVPMLLRGFRAEYPRVRFQLVQDYTDSMLDRLREGELDLCLLSPRPEGTELTSRRMGDQRLCLVVPTDHRLAGRRRVRLEEVAQDPFVTLEPGYGMRRITDALCAEAGFAPRISFEGEEAETLRGLVAAGLGVAVLPPASVPRPDLVELALASASARRELALVWSAVRPLPPPAVSFRDFVLSMKDRLPLHS